MREAFFFSCYNIPMAKTMTHYVCSACGRTSPKFMGRCPGCGSYGTMTEEIIEELPALSARGRSRVAASGGLTDAAPQRLKDIDEKAEPRIETGISELSQVLGGGVVAALGDQIMPVFRESFERHLFGIPPEKIKLLLSKLGDDAVALGAAIYAAKKGRV